MNFIFFELKLIRWISANRLVLKFLNALGGAFLKFREETVPEIELFLFDFRHVNYDETVCLNQYKK